MTLSPNGIIVSPTSTRMMTRLLRIEDASLETDLEPGARDFEKSGRTPLKISRSKPEAVYQSKVMLPANKTKPSTLF